MQSVRVFCEPVLLVSVHRELIAVLARAYLELTQLVPILERQQNIVVRRLAISARAEIYPDTGFLHPMIIPIQVFRAQSHRKVYLAHNILAAIQVFVHQRHFIVHICRSREYHRGVPARGALVDRGLRRGFDNLVRAA
jgi:hypothetical protein